VSDIHPYLIATLAKSEVITEPEWTPEGVRDFCQSRSRTRIFEWKPDQRLEQEWEFQFLQESD